MIYSKKNYYKHTVSDEKSLYCTENNYSFQIFIRKKHGRILFTIVNACSTIISNGESYITFF